MIIPEKITLEGSLVELKNITDEDYPALMDILNDLETMEHLVQYLGRTQWDAKATAERYDRFRKLQKNQENMTFKVLSKSTKKIAGTCGFKTVDLASKRGEFGIVLHRSVWGKGISNECHLLVLQYGFEKLNLDEIFFVTDKENLRMQGFFKKVGIPQMASREKDGSPTFTLKKEKWPEVKNKLVH